MDTYKKTISGTIGAGMNAIIKNAANYYILEHKVSSKYHKAGESQAIIVNFLELGRNKNCGVRFDETFKTVSRRHAAILKDGDKWKLITLSNTNSTFINGQKIDNEWYLQNGDEIQLSKNGPKLGFIIPDSSNATVLTIWQRIKLFNEQALRPYRTTLIIIGVMLLLMIGGGIGYGVYMNNNYKKAKEDAHQGILDLTKQADSIADKLKGQETITATQAEALQKLQELLRETESKINKMKEQEKESARKHKKEIYVLQKKIDDLQKELDFMKEEKRIEDEARQKSLDEILKNK